MQKFPNLISCNWKIIYGNGLESLVSVECGKEFNLAKMNIDDITSSERTVLLSRGDNTVTTTTTTSEDDDHTNNHCQININSSPKYSTAHIMLVCDCSTIELFTGKYEEYSRTCDGELLDEFDGTKSYIFEICLLKKVSHVTLKFITNQDQVWVYGLHMNLTEVPINIFKPSIDLANVQEMLSESQQSLSENAEKCKEFITAHMNSRKNTGPPNMAELMSFINAKMESTLIINGDGDVKEAQPYLGGVNGGSGDSYTNNGVDDNSVGSSASLKLPFGLEHSVDLAKMYFDTKLKEMEERILNKIDERLEEMEQRHNAKLDKILMLLTDK